LAVDRETQARAGAFGAAAAAIASFILFAVCWLWIVPDFVFLIAAAALLAEFASGFFAALRARVARGIVTAAAVGAFVVGASYAYLVGLGLALAEPGDDIQGLWTEFAISLMTVALGLLVLVVAWAPRAVSAAAATGALAAAGNAIFILAGPIAWDGAAVALPPAVVAVLFTRAAIRSAARVERRHR
jgi:hypothetical protein